MLVTDAGQRSALAIVRSLGRAGHRVYVSAGRAHSLAGASRYSRGEVVVADALSEPARFLHDIRAAVGRWGIDTLIPVTEPSLLAILPAAGEFSGVQIPFADAETFRRVSNKPLLLETAARFGIAVPAQQVLECSSDRAGLGLQSLTFPVVVKPARSVAEGGSGTRTKLSVQHAADASELARVLDAMDDSAYPLLLQQRIVGPGVGVFLLLWDGEPVAVFSHRRLREKPPSGGISVYCESIAADPALVARSRALLEHFGWRGVAMVEYKIDARTGTPYLMEVNGRFWGSLQLAVDAGVDFPALLLAAAAGAHPEHGASYRVGVRSRWWWGDIDHLWARMRRSATELALPPGSPTRWQAVRDFLRVTRGDRNEIFRPDDPRPFFRESVNWLNRR